jgi:DNA recombination protein RmuC
MIVGLLAVSLLVSFAALGCVVFLMFKSRADDAAAQVMFKELGEAQFRTEQAMRVELATNRQELNAALTANLTNLGNQLAQLGQANDLAIHQLKVESAGGQKEFRDSLVDSVTQSGDLQKERLDDFAKALATLAKENDAALTKLTDSNEKKLDAQRTILDARLQQIQAESATNAKSIRDEVGSTLKQSNESLDRLSTANQQRLDSLRNTVETKLQAIHDDNAKQLEQMRQTVDEKLQGTLDQRLGESFKLVSERLEAVQRGLGEMQGLAAGVGDLKKVLTNVSTRGTWGEVQLGALLEQVLAPDQYAAGVAVKGDGCRVEFAIRLPGRSEDRSEVVWLPIDAKFPMEDYRRLVEAQEQSDATASETAARQLERSVKESAKTIRDKYVGPPCTTDFAILFLPTEGLFAEVIRRPGLCETVQRDCRVVIAGPTTLWSLLNSLQLGFRTLAIQKRSSEVWRLLGAIKSEWQKYGAILDKVHKKIQQASNTIEEAQTRTRMIGKKLSGVEAAPSADAIELLGVEGALSDASDSSTDVSPAQRLALFE